MGSSEVLFVHSSLRVVWGKNFWSLLTEKTEGNLEKVHVWIEFISKISKKKSFFNSFVCQKSKNFYERNITAHKFYFIVEHMWMYLWKQPRSIFSEQTNDIWRIYNSKSCWKLQPNPTICTIWVQKKQSKSRFVSRLTCILNDID